LKLAVGGMSLGAAPVTRGSPETTVTAMGWLDRLRAKQHKTADEISAQRAGGRWENEGGALAPEEETPREAQDTDDDRADRPE
jgi:hypothetical protein